MVNSSKTKFKIILAGIILLGVPLFSGAQVVGQEVNFNIHPPSDLYGRETFSATLIKITNQLYFYVDSNWWIGLDLARRGKIKVSLSDLALEFEQRIYPILTSVFGSEPRPGIDTDERITVLIHPMVLGIGGYFNPGDAFSRFLYPRSNEREMVYLSSHHIDTPQAKGILAHEFMHLITVNQKDLLRRVTEEIWLNEARAEYVVTLLGYDDIFKGSNLERRVRVLLARPNVSLTEWLDRGEDYGAVNLFAQYLIDHYGIEILADSLRSPKVGIKSINYTLKKNHFDKIFTQIFADWLITLLVNDCQLGERFCYLNPNLRKFRVLPTFYHLPRTPTILSVYHAVAPWTLNWHRFIGGGGQVSFEFRGSELVKFKVPYLLCDLENFCSVGFLELDTQQRGKISFSQFNLEYSSLTFMPFIKSKISGFNGREETFPFSLGVVVGERPPTEAELRKQLLARIAELQEELRQLRAQLTLLLIKRDQPDIPFPGFKNDLYYGMMNNSEVHRLQIFLRAQGPEIYPEGLVTGNFFSLTRAAVIRFQEKYTSEILAPLGLKRGTGFIGPMTRAKINRLLGF